MVHEVLNRPLIQYVFYGCQCGWGEGSQIVDEIDRCCYEQYCCRIQFRTETCKPEIKAYIYTIQNGTLTCDDEDESSCARRSCECDRTAVFCFQSHMDSYSYSKAKYFLHRDKCSGQRPACSQL
ncbi:hypothetical protein GDO81_021165 [Engystomops pustulosus]|uniref:Phospholipase A2 n=1 Tax=Engystomops pustulosus TaxID=76066 RepID=A0AAV6ZCZ5_ENGPU|nr:hypothetical protein GDO81_021165 [Engystomops pustulosus]